MDQWWKDILMAVAAGSGMSSPSCGFRKQDEIVASQVECSNSTQSLNLSITAPS